MISHTDVLEKPSHPASRSTQTRRYRMQDMSAEFLFQHVLPLCDTWRQLADTGTPYNFLLKPENRNLRLSLKFLYGVLHATEMTNRQIHDVALQFVGPCARSRFHDEKRAVYNEAKRRRIFKKVTSHMGKGYRRWDNADSILEAARSCSSLKEFRTCCGGAYEAAGRLGIREELDLILEPGCKRIPLDELFSRASRFTTRRAFFEGDRAAYQSAVKRGYMNAIFDAYMRRGRDQVFAEAAQCDNALEFYTSYRDAWRSADEGGYLDEVLAYLLPSSEEIFAAAAECSGREDFRVNRRRLHDAAVKLGILEDVQSVWPEIRIRWTYERAREEAAKYDRYRDFQVQSPSAWWRAYLEGWLDEITSHMSRDQFAKKWPEAELYRRARLYKTRLEFRTHDLNAYVAAYNQGILHLIWDPRDKRTNPDMHGQTWVYRLTLGCYVYIGITNDLSKRFSAHREGESSHPRVQKIASEGQIDILDRTQGVDRWIPLEKVRGTRKEKVSLLRYEALSEERDLIASYSFREGLRLCNRHLNPLYDWSGQRWAWEAEEKAAILAAA